MHKTPGIFVTFEGGEGTGKTTQLQLLAQHLESEGRRVLNTREPGGTPLANQIRQLLLDETKHPDPVQELFLYEVARRDHVLEVIRPALQRGEVILCDRFIDSTLAYQGFGRGHPRALLETLNDLASGGCRPNLTLLLDLPVEAGLARSKARLQKGSLHEGRFETETREFHERVRQGFLTLATQEPERIKVIDATGEKDQVFARILSVWGQWEKCNRL